MSIYARRAFWVAAAERAIKTAAQTAIVTVGADTIDVLSADWVTIASMGAGGAVLSVLTSIASAKISSDAGPSLAGEELTG